MHALTMTRDDGASCANEMQLFHGTTQSAAEDIARQGFNRSYSGCNGTQYGKGVYFARDAAFALSYSPPAVRSGDRCFSPSRAAGRRAATD